MSRIAVFSFRSLPHWGRRTTSAVDRVLSYIVDLRRIPSLSFILLEPYPARSARHLPHAGKALCREKRHPRFVASPIGEGGTAIAEDRVLSFILDLRRISPLIFHTASTLSGSLRSPPSPRGEGFVSGIPLSPSNLRPFGAPPSMGRREYPRKPLPLEGAAERSEAGLAFFLGGKAASSLPSPLGKGDRAAVDRVLSFILDLRRNSPLIFHTARTLSGSLRSPPSPRGEG